MYKIEYSKEVRNDFSKLPKTEIIKILTKIDGLTENPRPPGVKSLQGKHKGLHRIRSGCYRIVYQIVDECLTVLVVRVSHRRSAYR